MGGKKNAPVIHVGASSLLVVFLVLCLVIFAALSLTAARNDAAYSGRAAERRTEYYAACGQAEALLEKLDDRLEAQGPAADLTDLGGEKDGAVWRFAVALNDTQAIALEIEPLDGGGRNYNLKSYRIVTTSDPAQQDPLPLIQVG